MKHLKTWPQYFEAVRGKTKPWEFRKNDREFQAGDLLCLEEWDPKTESYTGRHLWRRVTYIAYGDGVVIPSGYCCMTIQEVR